MINEFQRHLLESFPDIDLMAVDPTDEEGVDHAVRNRTTGNTLFNHLWLEFAEVEKKGAEGKPDILRILENMSDSIQAVRDQIEGDKPQEDLDLLRRHQAELAWCGYDFRGVGVAKRDDWDRAVSNREWACPVFFENPDSKTGPLIRGRFSVAFLDARSSLVEKAVAYVVAGGKVIGEYMPTDRRRAASAAFDTYDFGHHEKRGYNEFHAPAGGDRWEREVWFDAGGTTRKPKSVKGLFVVQFKPDRSAEIESVHACIGETLIGTPTLKSALKGPSI